jgi:hypothetical protein
MHAHVHGYMNGWTFMYACMCAYMYMCPCLCLWCVSWMDMRESRMDIDVRMSIHPSIRSFINPLEDSLAPDSGSAATEATRPPRPAARSLHTPLLAPVRRELRINANEGPIDY